MGADFLFLEDKQNYIDRYDLATIEECLSWYSGMKQGMQKHRSELESKNPEKDFDREVEK